MYTFMSNPQKTRIITHNLHIRYCSTKKWFPYRLWVQFMSWLSKDFVHSGLVHKSDEPKPPNKKQSVEQWDQRPGYIYKTAYQINSDTEPHLDLLVNGSLMTRHSFTSPNWLKYSRRPSRNTRAAYHNQVRQTDPRMQQKIQSHLVHSTGRGRERDGGRVRIWGKKKEKGGEYKEENRGEKVQGC